MKKTLTTLALLVAAGTAQAKTYPECLTPEVKDFESCQQIQALNERVATLEETIQSLLVSQAKAKAKVEVVQPKVETKPVTKTSSKDELELVSVSFGVDKFGISPQLRATVKNNTASEIVAWKGAMVCKDAFGDVAFRTKLNNKSANIAAGDTDNGLWELNMFGKAGSTIKNNDAKNFDCSLEDVKLVK
jgi:hypothetical protein